LKVDKVADFAITQIAFNPEGTYLACSSPANGVSLIPLQKGLEQQKGAMEWIMENQLVIMAIIILFLAIMYLFR
jgi:hypothetical protein